MTENVLSTNDDGEAVVFTISESAEERGQRLKESAAEAAKDFTLTEGQARTLARARRVAQRRI